MSNELGHWDQAVRIERLTNRVKELEEQAKRANQLILDLAEAVMEAGRVASAWGASEQASKVIQKIKNNNKGRP